MPKQPRSKLRAKGPDTSPVLPAETIYQPTQERMYLRCPVCGMMAPIEETDTSKPGLVIGFKGGPYVAEQRLQAYGGSYKSSTGDMKDRRGIMFWTDGEEISERQRNLLIDSLEVALQLLRGDESVLPVREAPVVEEVAPAVEVPVVTERDLVALYDMLDEDSKTGSINKMLKALGKIEAALDPDSVEAVRGATGEFLDIKRKGMTLEDYMEERSEAWDKVIETVGELTLKEGD